MNLDSYLTQNNLEHKEFAEKIGVDASYISLLRNYKRTPSLPVAMNISKVTGGLVKPCDLVQNNDS